MECTIVSLYPLDVNETKPGIYPGEFKIPAAKRGDMKVLVIGNSMHAVDVGEDRPQLRVEYGAEKIAQSVVMDLIVAKMEIKLGFAQPAIFWVPGALTVEEVKKKYPEKVAAAIEMQKKWFEELIKTADTDWGKHPGSHRAITDEAKQAVKELGFERPWNIDSAVMAKTTSCKFCLVSINENAMLCHNCKQPTKEEYRSLLNGTPVGAK